MEFVAFEPGIEVNGQTVFSVVDGFRAFTGLAAQYLTAEGIGRLRPDGSLELDLAGWFPQSAWLRAFQRISETTGQSVLHQIGLAIPRNAQFPPWVTDVHSAVRSVDIAYHMNHRKRGEVMFDPDGGGMLEGIGHYGYTPVEGQRRIISVCENPYPCAFDDGILTAMARRFEKYARVEHDSTKPCRHKGGQHCTYVISW